MSTVINFLRIFLLIIISILYLYGQGSLLFRFLLWDKTIKENELYKLRNFSLSLISGILLNFTIVLIFHNLKTSLIIGSCISFVGYLFLIKNFEKNKTTDLLSEQFIFSSVGILIIMTIYFSPIMTVPIIGWDGRSIWFFHAKMIYFNGTFHIPRELNNPAYGFSHVDYPKLIPVMAAQINYLVGYWNEYLPKLSLWILYFPPTIYINSFSKRNISYIFLLVLLPLAFYPYLWNGFMDGLLALYVAIGLLLLIEYLENGQKNDLLSALSCIFLIMNIKNEGLLSAIALVMAFLIYQTMNKKLSFKKLDLIIHWRKLLFLFISISPVIIWIIYKNHLGLVNDLNLGSTKSFQMLISRLTDGSYKLILTSVYLQIKGMIYIIGLIGVVNLLLKNSIKKELLLSLITAIIISAGLILIYLFTPHDLNWHLNSSTERTMLVVNGCLIISGYTLLKHLEIDII